MSTALHSLWAHPTRRIRGEQLDGEYAVGADPVSGRALALDRVSVLRAQRDALVAELVHLREPKGRIARLVNADVATVEAMVSRATARLEQAA